MSKKMRELSILAAFIVFLSVFPSKSGAQSDKEEIPWSMNEGTLIGIGRYNLMDTYLTPAYQYNYTGLGVRVLNERMRMVHLSNYNISRQQIINIDLASTENGPSTSSELAGFVDYSLGYHYHIPVLPDLKVLAGSSVHGMAGFIYNTRNGNNPASAKADIDLNISAMVLYNLRIKGYPLTLRYQMEIPFAGVLFSPHYGQSYYEIFNLGNGAGVVQFNSFHNKFAMKNYFTVDLPICNFTVRMGYLNSSYRTDVNGIQSHIISHSFMIGLVKEFVSFGGKRLKNTSQYRSAYY